MNGMPALVAAVFTASVLGSLHCAGMCGAFLLFAVGAGDEPDGRPRRLRWPYHAAYHGGRLVTYTLLGAAAGTLGAALDFGGSFVGVQRLAAVLAGAMMIAFGVGAVLRLRGVAIGKPPVPKPLLKFVERAQSLAFRLPPFSRALAIGLLTTLLPCGWLYAFAITAAGTADPVWGAVTMAVFWSGTLPVMVSLGVGFSALTGPLRRRVPLITACALVGVGLWTVLGRVTAPGVRMEQLPAVATAPIRDADSARRAVEHAQETDCPLCHPTPTPTPNAEPERTLP